MAFAKAPTSEIRKACQAGGMRTLMEDGKIKVFRGTTTRAGSCLDCSSGRRAYLGLNEDVFKEYQKWQQLRWTA